VNSRNNRRRVDYIDMTTGNIFFITSDTNSGREDYVDIVDVIDIITENISSIIIVTNIYRGDLIDITTFFISSTIFTDVLVIFSYIVTLISE
jgi:hypothetical protein